MKNKLVVVCGPTATGKSDYAVTLAKKINGEIISADSRQVYKGFDIGSGKIPRDRRPPRTYPLETRTYFYKGVPHHLLDVADPKRVFTVTRYQKLVVKAIVDITKRKKVPIICGGTGFYIDAIIYGTDFPAVPPNPALRKRLCSNSAIANFEYIQRLDPERAAQLDPHNNIRIIRAIEIATALGKVPKVKREAQYDVEWHYLDFPDEILKTRIHDRLLKRMKGGMVKEVEQLKMKGVSWKRLESLGLEYRYLALYLQKKLGKQDMLTQLESAIWHYAKRQRTWFKKYAK